MTKRTHLESGIEKSLLIGLRPMREHATMHGDACSIFHLLVRDFWSFHRVGFSYKYVVMRETLTLMVDASNPNLLC